MDIYIVPYTSSDRLRALYIKQPTSRKNIVNHLIDHFQKKKSLYKSN